MRCFNQLNCISIARGTVREDGFVPANAWEGNESTGDGRGLYAQVHSPPFSIPTQLVK